MRACSISSAFILSASSACDSANKHAANEEYRFYIGSEEFLNSNVDTARIFLPLNMPGNDAGECFCHKVDDLDPADNRESGEKSVRQI